MEQEYSWFDWKNGTAKNKELYSVISTANCYGITAYCNSPRRLPHLL